MGREALAGALSALSVACGGWAAAQGLPAVVTAAAAAPSGVSAADAAELRAFFAQLYGSYRQGVDRAGVTGLGLDAVYAPSTAALERTFERLCAAQECGVMSSNDADAFIGGAQDYGDLRFTGFGRSSLEPRSGLLKLEVRYDWTWPGELKTSRHTQGYAMQKTPAGWRVFDVGGHRAALQSDIAELRRTARPVPRGR